MDNEPQSEPEFTAQPYLDGHGPFPHGHASSFFSQSKHFGISGGNFTNVNEADSSRPSGGARDHAFFPNSKDFV
ncbi:hypothetical protein B0H19DRAFT_1383956, partial [Mycena capillaripes]